MLLDDAALENKDQSVDNQRDFDIRWTANSLYAGEFCTRYCFRVHEAQASPAFFSKLRHRKSDRDPHYVVTLSLQSPRSSQTISAISHFFLAMIQHPEILRKAQKEIDSVVGNTRLPTFSDRANLPYMDALVCESLRVSSPVPLGKW